MSGFEPMFMAGATEIGTTTLATEVMAPEFLGTVGGAEFGTPALFEGLGGGLGGALGSGLGGISGLFGTAAEGTLANGLAPTLAQNLSVAAPEALAQTQNAVLNAGIGANQGIGATVAQQVSPVASEMNLAGEAFNPVLGGNQGIGAAVTPQVEAAQSEMLKGLAETNPSLTPEQLAQRDLLRGSGYGEPTGGLDSLKQMMSKAGNWWDSKSDKEKMLYGGAGLLGANALLGKKQGVPNAAPYSGPLSKFHYNPSVYTPYTPQPPANPYRPVYTSYAHGGLADLGGYSDGGRMLKGPGDGMSDDIPATIANKQPARLANEEFVVPADVVSHLGNGSSEAGAKQLYKMMDRVRQARTGNKKQGKQINPEKYLA
jgi:hypothetical protein